MYKKHRSNARKSMVSIGFISHAVIISGEIFFQDPIKYQAFVEFTLRDTAFLLIIKIVLVRRWWHCELL